VTLTDFLADADALVGQRVKVVGWLHAGVVRLWLADQPHCAKRMVVVNAPEVTRWFWVNVPPRVGGVCAYYVEAEVRGEARPRNWEGLPVVGGEVIVTFQHDGRVLTLRGGHT
jgi:hypothetical protein